MQKKTKSLITLVGAIALMVSIAPAQASLIVTESFDYGGVDLGSASGLNGGTGFGGDWAPGLNADSSTYESAGLTFSDLAVSGGNVTVSSPAFTVAGRRTFSREIGVTQTGTIWGSFLFSTSDAVQPGSGVIVDNIAGPMDQQGTFAVYPTRDASGPGKTILNNSSANNPGSNIATNTTYMTLFKMTNLGPASASHTFDTWVLTEAQYDNFKSGGLEEAELNAATLGTGATQVQQRASRTSSFVGTFTTTDYLALNVVGNSVISDFDEFRISNAGLAEVAPTLIADIGGDWVNASTLPTNWEYLESTAATGGSEVALTGGTVVGGEGSLGFGGGANGLELSAVLGDNANGGEYEIFTDGQANHGGVEGTDLLVHPSGAGISPTGEPFVIARYTISAADILNGRVASIEGGFQSVLGGGVDVSVLLNGTTLFSASGAVLRDSTGAFSINTIVAAGDTISFVVGSGADIFGDETSIRGTILLSHAIPTPAALPAGLALIGLIAARRRR